MIKKNIKIMATNDAQIREILRILSIPGTVKIPSSVHEMYFLIEDEDSIYSAFEKSKYLESDYQKIDADLFIRTNGTCIENQAKSLLKKLENMEDVEIYTAKEFNNIKLKLKKKNELLRKAKIKRRDQREALHILNVKLQKCISLEEHRKICDNYILRNQLLEKVARELSNTNISKIDKIFKEKDKEIEKLKTIIGYLEEKLK